MCDYVLCYALSYYFQHKKCTGATQAGLFEIIRHKVYLYNKSLLNDFFDEVVGAASFSQFLQNSFLFEFTQ